MYQRIIIIGNIGSDAELRYLPDGTPVCTFSLADSRVVTKGKDETTWFRVTRFGKQAEALAWERARWTFGAPITQVIVYDRFLNTSKKVS